MSSFNGFDKQAVAFLQSLQANNTRDWFNDHKKDYERFLKHPAAEFSANICAELEALTATPISHKVFRIHRDVRFSKDKTPYNCHLHISFVPEYEGATPPAWFFGLETNRLVLGAGLFGFDKEQLGHYREKVAYDAKSLTRVLTPLLNSGYTQPEPELKRVPSGYDKAHPEAELLKRKGLTLWHSFDNTEVATSKNVVDVCMQHFAALHPLVTWLAQKV